MGRGRILGGYIFQTMENRNYKSQKSLSRGGSAVRRPKFTPLPTNQLNNRYQLFQTGTPNSYSTDMTMLKARNAKAEMGTVELGGLESVLDGMGKVEKDSTINKRNYEQYPSLLKTKNNFKDLLSQKQEIKDFIIWFEEQFRTIQQQPGSNSQKFQQKQTLIASGFSEMSTQVAKTSKHRAEILRMLWNRQTQQVSIALEAQHKQALSKEKSSLEEISGLHREYQEEMEHLTYRNQQLEELHRKEREFAHDCVWSLRVLRRRLKKCEFATKKLAESGIAIRRENLNLIEQNIKLVMSTGEVPPEEAVLLNYRRMQVHKEKEKLRVRKSKDFIQQALNEAPLEELERKKRELYDFFKERLAEHPEERELLKEECYLDEDEGLEDYFAAVMGRPSVQAQLLNEQVISSSFKERGTNTVVSEPEPLPIQILAPSSLAITYDKGIQVDADYGKHKSGRESLASEGQQLVQHLNVGSHDQSIEAETKKMIRQHRISRKSSLALLEIQNAQTGKRKSRMAKPASESKPQKLSGFADKSIRKDLEELKEEAEVEKEGVESSHEGFSSKQDSDDELMLEPISLCKQPSNGVAMQEFPTAVRRSEDFQTFLEGISRPQKEIQRSQVRKRTQLSKMTVVGNGPILLSAPEQPNRRSLLSVETIGQSRESMGSSGAEERCNSSYHKRESSAEKDWKVKVGQVDDLIAKHISQKQPGKALQNPEKVLNKALLAVHKACFKKQNLSFRLELLETLRNSYGSNNNAMWKFLNTVTTIKDNQGKHSLLRACALLLGVSQKFSHYSAVSTDEIGRLYFRLFGFLSLKSMEDNAFSLWKACTSRQRIRSHQFLQLLGTFLSDKKRGYVEGKLEELAGGKKGKGEEGQIFKLHSVILYVLQVYLIEKQLYYDSYHQLMHLLGDKQQGIPVPTLATLLHAMALPEAKQREILSHLLTLSPPQPHLCPWDAFYRCCVRFDLPLFEELSMGVHLRFRQLDPSTAQRYFGSIGVERWGELNRELVERFEETGASEIDRWTFQDMVGRLQREGRGQGGVWEQSRRQKEFTTCYKMLILQAHPGQ